MGSPVPAGPQACLECGHVWLDLNPETLRAYVAKHGKAEAVAKLAVPEAAARRRTSLTSPAPPPSDGAYPGGDRGGTKTKLRLAVIVTCTICCAFAWLGRSQALPSLAVAHAIEDALDLDSGPAALAGDRVEDGAGAGGIALGVEVRRDPAEGEALGPLLGGDGGDVGLLLDGAGPRRPRRRPRSPCGGRPA